MLNLILPQPNSSYVKRQSTSRRESFGALPIFNCWSHNDFINEYIYHPLVPYNNILYWYLIIHYSDNFSETMWNMCMAVPWLPHNVATILNLDNWLQQLESAIFSRKHWYIYTLLDIVVPWLPHNVATVSNLDHWL